MGINVCYADGTYLKNILLLVTITPGQLITINSSQRKKSRNLTKCAHRPNHVDVTVSICPK